jgi:hypothetical protein
MVEVAVDIIYQVDCRMDGFEQGLSRIFHPSPFTLLFEFENCHVILKGFGRISKVHDNL